MLSYENITRSNNATTRTKCVILVHLHSLKCVIPLTLQQFAYNYDPCLIDECNFLYFNSL